MLPMYAENGEMWWRGEGKYRLSISSGKVRLCPSALDFPLPSQLPPLSPPPTTSPPPLCKKNCGCLRCVCVDLWLVSQCGCSDEQCGCVLRGERVVQALTGFVAWGRSIKLRKIQQKLQKCNSVLFQSIKLCIFSYVEQRVNVARFLGTEADDKCT